MPQTKRRKNKSSGTQTAPLDAELEIARLQEQVKLLTIENEVLRKHKIDRSSSVLKVATPVKNTNSNIKVTPENEPGRSKRYTLSVQKNSAKVTMRGCSCKGNCSSKICGCVKKDSKCGELCRCSNVSCKNQEPKEAETNKENLDSANTEVPRPDIQVVVNKRVKNVEKSKGLFSPDVDEYNQDLNTDKSRHSSLYFGPSKSLTFTSDEENEVTEKEIAKEKTKNKRQDDDNIQKRRGRPKKDTLHPTTVEYTRKLRSSSNEEKRIAAALPAEKPSLRRSKSSELEIQRSKSNKLIQTESDDLQSVKNDTASLRQGPKKSTKATTVANDENTVDNSNVNIRNNRRIMENFDSEASNDTPETGANMRNNRRIMEDSDSETDNDSPETGETEIKVNVSSADNSPESIPSDTVQSHCSSESKEYDLFEDINFDPTKPTHQLQRTPTHSSSETTLLSVSDIPLPPPLTFYEEKEKEEEYAIPAEFNQPEVDWLKYQSQLVSCGKCKRKFHPVRIKKHESCCKKT